MLSNRSRSKGRIATGLAGTTWVLAAMLAGGCATAPPAPEEPKLVWPAPPEPARIQFVRSITSKDDLKSDTTFTSAMATFLAGEQIPDGRIASPAGLAISADAQRLYVADPLQHMVFVFDFALRELRKIEVGYPTGVALDDQENVYVVDGVEKGVKV